MSLSHRWPLVVSLWIFSAGAFLSSGCGSGGRACQTASDCALGESCNLTATGDGGVAGMCGSSSSVEPTCKMDGDCKIGQLCEGGKCVAGCRSGRDCPAATPLCDPAGGEHGACVECIKTTDCAAMQECAQGTCVSTCTTDLDCPGARCDTQQHICVQCLSASDCSLGDVCASGSCVAGCGGDRDCPAATPHCAPNQGPHGTCLQCVQPSDCGDPSMWACNAGSCAATCHGDADCPGTHCDTGAGVCVECVSKDQCPIGDLCLSDACVPGCQTDRDCTTGLHCDPSAGPHGTCVQCTGEGQGTCAAGQTCTNHVCTGGTDGTPMVDVPGGAFTMGSGTDPASSDDLAHQVTLDDFSIDKYEVTNAQYAKCVQAGACKPPRQVLDYGDPAKASWPVTYVPFDLATDYCAWAGKRLPTEAEWEKAARGTDARTYPWGETDPTCTVVNAGVGTFPALYCSTMSILTSNLVNVGGYPAGESPYGADDMAGNAREWVADWYQAILATTAAQNPLGPDVGTMKLARGGNFTSYAADLTTYVRSQRDPILANDVIGFRCASSPALVARLRMPNGDDIAGNGMVMLDASSSSSPAGGLMFRWDFTSDGAWDTSFSAVSAGSYIFALPGNYRVTVQVQDGAGHVATASRGVTVRGNGTDGSPCQSSTDCFFIYACDIDVGSCWPPCGTNSTCTSSSETCRTTDSDTGAASLCE